MKILIVSWCFPPFNMIGSVRVGKTAKYLHQSGHDVRVLAAEDLLVDPSQNVELPESHVLRTPWTRLDSPAIWLLGGQEHVREKGYERKGKLGILLENFKPFYRMLVHFPDAQVGWIRPALSGVVPWLDGWRPDIIMASSLPLSSAWVAYFLSKRLGVPWVSDLRDLAGMDRAPRSIFESVRRPLDEWAFDYVMSKASGLVTVSEPMREWLSKRFPSIPTECVYNGFDPTDFPPNVEVPYNDGDLHITHTGSLYDGWRDPRPLFKAIALLEPHERVKIHVHFYGRYTQVAADAAKEENVSEQVNIHASIPYEDALHAQMSSDLLLLIMVDDPSKDGSYTGKFFEYLGAGRPILAIGRHQNSACKLITERNAGFVSLRPDELAEQLRTWLSTKAESKGLRRNTQDITRGFSREEQTHVFANFFQHIKNLQP